MCCIFTNLFKIVVVFCSVGILFILNLLMLIDLHQYPNTGLSQYPNSYYAIWIFHSWCGTLLTVLKLKDLCYLHWWQLMTSAYIIVGLVLNFLQRENESFGLHQRLCNYFVIEYMMLSLFSVVCYTRKLRSQEDL